MLRLGSDAVGIAVFGGGFAGVALEGLGKGKGVTVAHLGGDGFDLDGIGVIIYSYCAIV